MKQKNFLFQIFLFVGIFLGCSETKTSSKETPVVASEAPAVDTIKVRAIIKEIVDKLSTPKAEKWAHENLFSYYPTNISLLEDLNNIPQATGEVDEKRYLSDMKNVFEKYDFHFKTTWTEICTRAGVLGLPKEDNTLIWYPGKKVTFEKDTFFIVNAHWWKNSGTYAEGQQTINISKIHTDYQQWSDVAKEIGVKYPTFEQYTLAIIGQELFHSRIDGSNQNYFEACSEIPSLKIGKEIYTLFRIFSAYSHLLYTDPGPLPEGYQTLTDIYKKNIESCGLRINPVAQPLISSQEELDNLQREELKKFIVLLKKLPPEFCTCVLNKSIAAFEKLTP